MLKTSSVIQMGVSQIDFLMPSLEEREGVRWLKMEIWLAPIQLCYNYHVVSAAMKKRDLAILSFKKLEIFIFFMGKTKKMINFHQ